MKSNIKIYAILYSILFLLSLTGICSKMAAQNEFLSFWWLFWYVAVILLLGIYAVVWQQVIKRIPLNTAYANKAVIIVWGILWGALIFGERVKWNMILGAVIVICGVIMVVKADEG